MVLIAIYKYLGAQIIVAASCGIIYEYTVGVTHMGCVRLLSFVFVPARDKGSASTSLAWLV